MKIKTVWPEIDTALETLRKNPSLSPMISELEKSTWDILIIRDPSQATSQTGDSRLPTFVVYINEIGGAEVTEKKWGIKGTKLENSIAHELGHVHMQHRLSLKPIPPPVSAKTGKPIPKAAWENQLSECAARLWDTASRPPGVVIPC